MTIKCWCALRRKEKNKHSFYVLIGEEKTWHTRTRMLLHTDLLESESARMEFDSFFLFSIYILFTNKQEKYQKIKQWAGSDHSCLILNSNNMLTHCRVSAHSYHETNIIVTLPFFDWARERDRDRDRERQCTIIFFCSERTIVSLIHTVWGLPASSSLHMLPGKLSFMVPQYFWCNWDFLHYLGISSPDK